MVLGTTKKENIKIKDFSICGGVAANKYLNSLLKNFLFLTHQVH